MDPSLPAPHEAAPLALMGWIGVGIALLGAHATIGLLRRARKALDTRVRWGCHALASVALGSTVWAVAVLDTTSEPLGFALGYAPRPMLLAGAFAMFAAALALMPIVRRDEGFFAVVLPPLLLALAMPLVQAAPLLAAGLEPGVEWKFEQLLPAPTVLVVGAAIAFSLAFGPTRLRSGGRAMRRAAAALLLGCAIAISQGSVIDASTLATQLASGSAGWVEALRLAVIAATAVPALLLLCLVPVSVRLGAGDEGADSLTALFSPPKRRRHRSTRRERAPTSAPTAGRRTASR
jgi:NO-binding membrane sensor protein with MHYT domain